MITKTHKTDLGLGLPEKKKKKKKKVMVREPETQYSVLNNDNYFADVYPTRSASPSDNVGQEQVPEIPLGKKKKKKKGHSTLCEELLGPEPTARATQAKSPSPRKQTCGHPEFPSGEKKKRKKSFPLASNRGSSVKTSPAPTQATEVTRAVRKLKKHKKEKKTQDPVAVPTQAPWLYEAGDAPSACAAGKEAAEPAVLGQKRRQASPRAPSGKTKKKKTRQEGDPRPSRSLESSPRRESKKKSGQVEGLEYIPIEDGPKRPGKKKKSKTKVEQPGVEELALKKKKRRRRKESGAAEDPWGEEGSDTDLEVVSEKKGNMDETCIDQVRRRALQEEIDRESGKTEPSEPKKWTGTQFGQWDTAGFESEEQKLKFLKLMGSFKHLSPSFSRPPSVAGAGTGLGTGLPTMALGRKAAAALHQDLLRDFNRAMSWKYSRGAGLGFAAARDKVFYIDRGTAGPARPDD